VTDGVFRIPLPLPDDALRAVNVYAIADGDGLTLVDGGWAIADAQQRLTSSLAEVGFHLSDIRRILVTHIHRDHYSQALAIRELLGIRVLLGEHERSNIDMFQMARQRGQSEYYGLARMVRSGAQHLGEMLSERIRQWPVLPYDLAPDGWLTHDETVELTDRRLAVLHTPGHTVGHVAFRDPDANILFAGDHVLPHITPSISLEAAQPALPLADYLASLTMIRSLPDQQLLPAHGPAGGSVHARVDELVAHHEERLVATAAALDAGPETAFEVAGVLRWTRRGLRLTDLDVEHSSFAIGESLAHLDLLVARGRAQCSIDDHGVAHFHRLGSD
jgi:glyoxylase-like metal-dependent hydrolase (beta-lactamase superfamily II)